MIDETQPFAIGVQQANIESGGTPETEAADVKKWLKAITEARAFDENSRKRYAIDRQFARGSKGGAEVGLPIAATYVDILKAFLYAKDPDLDVQPADGTRPPPMAEIAKMAREQVLADPQTQMAMDAAGQGAAQQAQAQAAQQIAGAVLPALAGGKPADGAQSAAPPVDPQQAAQAGAQAALEQLVKQRADQIMAPYRQRATEAKQFGQTIESVVSFLWRKGRLKAAGEPQVASALTCGPGWIKVTWQERTGTDPVMKSQLDDVQDNLRRLAAGQLELPDAADPYAKRAELEQLQAGLSAKVEKVIARGLVIDFIAAEDVQVAPGTNLYNYREAPWIAHRTFMSMEDAKAAFPNLMGDGESNKIAKATTYYQIKPRDTQDEDVGAMSSCSPEDADSFKTGASPTGNSDASNVCVWELWNKSTNQVLTFIEGCDCYAKEPYAPNPGTSRFYSFFQYAPTQVDGERHPQSLIQRTEPLLMDMNRIYSNRAEWRRRTIPKTVFDAATMDPKDADRIKQGGAQEMIPIKPTVPGTNVGNMVSPLKYASFDAALYDDGATRAQLEMAWGIQEALASSIQTAKTATEAEIQKTGTEARTGYMRDCLDTMFDDLAEYTAEVALQKMTREDVIRIAGPFAFWPQALSIEDLSTLVDVRIQAGSSGKPNTSAQQQAWSTVLPILQNAIMSIGQLRGSAPDAIADCQEALVAETLSRMGDKIDPDRFLPSAPDNTGMPMQPAMQPAPMPAAQPNAVPPGAMLQ